jgi:thioredoxin reductase (NADPH)
MYLSTFAKNVFIAVRRESLVSSMSSYLIDQLDKTENIELLPFTEVHEACGDGNLQKLVLKDSNDGSLRDAEADGLFIFIGAKPYTEWIKSSIIKNERGYLETGKELARYDEYSKVWKLDRQPFLLETCSPGIFAAGDVRAGAMNRVASAVGEGAMSIKYVHEYLADSNL